MYPEILAKILKSYRKNLKKCAIASFRQTERVHHVSNFFIARQAHNKIFNLDSKSHISTMPPKKKPRRDICAKCTPVCPFENNDCCMVHILSKQDDFANQISVLESVILCLSKWGNIPRTTYIVPRNIFYAVKTFPFVHYHSLNVINAPNIFQVCPEILFECANIYILAPNIFMLVRIYLCCPRKHFGVPGKFLVFPLKIIHCAKIFSNPRKHLVGP